MQEGLPIQTPIDRVPELHPVVEAYFYNCKYQALGYASLGLVFVVASLLSGAVLYRKKGLRDLTKDLLTFSLIGGCALSTSMLVVSTYKYIKYATALESPQGAFELEYGSEAMDKAHLQVLQVPTSLAD